MCFFALPLSAQVVYGTAHVAATRGVSQTSNVGSSETSVVLVDTIGSLVAGAITDENGAYMLRAPRPGTYRARARRIGFAPDSSRTIILAAGATVAFNPLMRELPQKLADVKIEAGARCAIAPEAGAAALRLWQDAQNALSGAAVSSVSGTHSFMLTRFQRQLDLWTKRVIRQTRWKISVRSSESYTSPPAESLANAGFVTRVGHDAVYSAPDARTLLSDAFAATHCFRPIPGSSGTDTDTDLIGLAFKPVALGARTDVAGILWLSESTGKLRYMEFQYVDSADDGRDSTQAARQARGRIDYRELPDGSWIIGSWTIRVPVVVFFPRRRFWGSPGSTHFDSTTTDSVPRVMALWEFGGSAGEVAMPAQRGDRTEASVTSLGSIDGLLVDSVAQKGVPDVDVIVQAATDATHLSRVARQSRTDSLGHFSFDSVTAGSYALRFQSPLLDTLGITVPPAAVSLLSGNRVTLTTIVPASAVSGECADSTEAALTDQRIVHGVIRDAVSGRPLVSAPVLAGWFPAERVYTASQIATPIIQSRAVTDTAGAYILCGLPLDRTIVVTATAPSSRTTSFHIDPPTGRDHRVVMRDVDVSSERMADSTRGSISGIVQDPSGLGIAQVEIALLDNAAARVRTNTEGVFRIDGVAPGSHLLQMRGVGLTPFMQPVDVTRQNVASMDVVLTALPPTLRMVEVKAQSGDVLSLPRDVAARVHSSRGRYFIAGDVRLRSATNTSDVFRYVPGVVVKDDRVFITRGATSLRGSACPRGIPLYLNGNAMLGNSLSVIAPSEIAAIEYYATPETMPTSVRSSPCGVILIWTK